MASLMDWVRGRIGRGEKVASLERAGVFRAGASRPEDLLAGELSLVSRVEGSFIPLPSGTPFFMLDVFRFFRDTIPDISDAVWTWKRLCQTGFDIDVRDPSSDVAKRRAERLLHELNGRVNGGDRGMDGLMDIFYTSLFTFGAAALEIVLTKSREQIFDIVPVDVWTVRFRRENGKLQAYQLSGGEEVKLPMDRFIYVGMDRDGTNPYGRSMLRSIPFLVKIQQRLIEDMAKATHNAGWPKLHVSYKPEEQVITGTHLMPILLGRNYGTTETYGTAQFEIINRQVEAVNRNVKRILERLYNFELAMMWGSASAKVNMRTNRTVDVLKEAQARSREIDNAIKLRDEGFLDHEGAAATLGLD